MQISLCQLVVVENGLSTAGIILASKMYWGRPPTSMLPIREAPFVYAPVWPIVSNTQGGPVHDAAQRILRPDGSAISGLYAAGEMGSLFGHLYMSGGNIAECFVGGRLAGLGAASGALP